MESSTKQSFFFLQGIPTHRQTIGWKAVTLNIPVGIRFSTLQIGRVKTTRIMFVVTICKFLLNQHWRLLQSQSTSKKYQKKKKKRVQGTRAFCVDNESKNKENAVQTSSNEAKVLDSLSRHYCHEYRIIRKTLERTFTYFHQNAYERAPKSCVPLLHYFIIISFVRIKIS